ncbi:MAG TPA: bifunctional 4-hydroxy-3-methylbut-2-enyl diphosphate reductase/30S ribosomal protein S1 [Clostridia bacterium]|nr:bifunctional 4-hydroxy-3-methylbut-2-enyl diphosphate reductase/30S ribosomal protein S1 [Clostridia bacterium]
MKIVLAKSAGFCFGVEKAVLAAETIISSKNNECIYCLGEIIHNDEVIDRLKQTGIKFVESISQIEDNSNVIIRAHGEGPDIYDELLKKNVIINDATCPYVKKIQHLVYDKHKEGYQIIIIGDMNHPEVIGINGWCENSAIIINSKEEAETVHDELSKICVIAQTTITFEKWKLIVDILNKKYENTLQFNTICNATAERQNEGIEIARSADIMFVIGGTESSNTQKLFEVCKRYCQKTYKISTAKDIPNIDFSSVRVIGITAGASTPDWIIKEVKKVMDEISKNDTELSFEEALEQSMKKVQSGQVTKGTIFGFNNSEVFVDLGFKTDGIIPMEEFVEDPDFNPETSLKKGQEVEVYVVRVSDIDGITLSKRKVDAIKNIDIIEKYYKEKTPVKAKITEIVKGGIIAYFGGVRIFIPGSQVSDHYVEDLGKYLSEELEFLIIEFNKEKKKIIGSVKMMKNREKSRLSNDFWANVEVGKTYQGKVKSFIDPGAFIDLGGVDGFAHISELTWEKDKRPADVLTIGDTVEVRIKSIDKDNKKVALRYKKLEDNPLLAAYNKYNIEDVVECTIKRILPFGLFVELEKGVEGFVHISQISDFRIAKPSDVVSVDQKVEAKIIEKYEKTKKINLSIKAVNPINPSKKETDAADTKEKEEIIPTSHVEEMTVTLGDMVNNEDNKASE